MANRFPILLNGVSSTVQAGSSAIGSSSATGVNVGTGDGANFGTIGTDQFIPALIVDTSTSPETIKEYVWITARSTDALTIVRAAEDSTRFPASITTIQAGYTIVAVASHDGLGSAVAGLWRPGLNLLLAAAFDPALASTASGALDDNFVLVKIPIPYTMTVSNLLIGVVSAQTGTPTSGHNFVGLYDTSGTRLAQSVDLSGASPWLSTGLKTIAFSSSVTINGGPGVYVYGAQINNESSSPPTFAVRPAGNGGVDHNANLAAANGFRCGKKAGQTGLASSVSLSTFTATTNEYWMGLS